MVLEECNRIVADAYDMKRSIRRMVNAIFGTSLQRSNKY